jgi:catechol 2,3-dioxygenase-like lactoylglutathione lyase family enzyme
MSDEAQFKKAFPYQKDVMALPVKDLDAASQWYCAHFGMVEVERRQQPIPRPLFLNGMARGSASP